MAATVVLGPLSEEDYQWLVASACKMQASLPLKELHEGGRTYTGCFTGTDAVKWLTAKTATNAEEAIGVGNAMISAGLLHHISFEFMLEDEAHFYQFAANLPELVQHLMSERRGVTRRSDGDRTAAYRRLFAEQGPPSPSGSQVGAPSPHDGRRSEDVQSGTDLGRWVERAWWGAWPEPSEPPPRASPKPAEATALPAKEPKKGEKEKGEGGRVVSEEGRDRSLSAMFGALAAEAKKQGFDASALWGSSPDAKTEKRKEEKPRDKADDKAGASKAGGGAEKEAGAEAGAGRGARERWVQQLVDGRAAALQSENLSLRTQVGVMAREMRGVQAHSESAHAALAHLIRLTWAAILLAVVLPVVTHPAARMALLCGFGAWANTIVSDPTCYRALMQPHRLSPAAAPALRTPTKYLEQVIKPPTPVRAPPPAPDPYPDPPSPHHMWLTRHSRGSQPSAEPSAQPPTPSDATQSTSPAAAAAPESTVPGIPLTRAGVGMIPVEQWPERPNLLRPGLPRDLQQVRIKAEGEAEAVRWRRDEGGLVDAPATSLGHGRVVFFETRLFQGALILTFDQFKHKMQYVVQGQFKKALPIGQVKTGEVFERPLNLPVEWVFKMCIMGAQLVYPTMEADLTGDAPHALNQLFSSMDYVHAAKPEQCPALRDFQGATWEDTSALGEQFAKGHDRVSRSKLLVSNPALNEVCYRTDLVYSFELELDNYVDLKSWEMNFPMFSGIDICKIINLQPVYLMAQYCAPGKDPEFLWNFEMWHERLLDPANIAAGADKP